MVAMTSDSAVADVVGRARVAQQTFAAGDQAAVDEAVVAIAWSLYKPDNAKDLAELAVAGAGWAESCSMRPSRNAT